MFILLTDWEGKPVALNIVWMSGMHPHDNKDMASTRVWIGESSDSYVLVKEDIKTIMDKVAKATTDL
jgi:hypothetical protein